jgi:hypothetical protein
MQPCWSRMAASALAANLITHPVFWWSAHRWAGSAALLVEEVVVVMAEWFMISFALWDRRSAVLLAAVLANCASALAGTLLLSRIMVGVVTGASS